MVAIAVADHHRIYVVDPLMLQIGRDHRFTAIKVLAEPRSRIVNEHMARGLDHGREPGVSKN